MASQSERVDVESLQRSASSTGRWLDHCLVLSVVILFAGLASLAIAGVWVVHNLQPPKEPEMSKLIGDSAVNTFKMENFAYLEAIPDGLNNRTITWTEVSHLAGKSVGSNFNFNSKQHLLQVKQEGKYFMYIDLNITCIGICKSGLLRVQVADKLSCDVHLPHPDSPDSFTVQRKCWSVRSLSADTSLLSRMSLPQGPVGHWRLADNGTGFGMFLVG